MRTRMHVNSPPCSVPYEDGSAALEVGVDTLGTVGRLPEPGLLSDLVLEDLSHALGEFAAQGPSH